MDCYLTGDQHAQVAVTTGALALDFQTVFNAVFAIAGAVGPLIVKSIFDRIKDAKDSSQRAEDRGAAAERALLEYKSHVAETYVQAKRFDGFEERLFAELQKIRERLDDKADRR